MAIKILELLTFVFLNKPFLAKAAAEPILKIIAKFKKDDKVSELILKTIVPQSLAKLLGIKKEEMLKLSASPLTQDLISMKFGKK